MPILFERKVVLVRSGMRCDCCNRTDEEGFNNFAISHTLGYDSPCDMGSIEAAICDRCLLALALGHIPGAVFRDASGQPVSRDEMAENLARYDANAPG
jgi:hypothetical protein